MSFIDKIAKAEANVKTPWFQPGNFRVKLKKCNAFESKKKDTTIVVVECEVLSFEPKENTKATEFPVGSTVAWLPDMSQKPTPGNLKKFALEVFKQLAINKGQDPNLVTDEAITADVLKKIFSEDSWAVGLEMDVTAFTVKTKADKDFTVVNFTARKA